MYFGMIQLHGNHSAEICSACNVKDEDILNTHKTQINQNKNVCCNVCLESHTQKGNSHISEANKELEVIKWLLLYLLLKYLTHPESIMCSS